MLEVRRLRLLRELADRGTIAATAEACALTPSAVSQQLSQLEREVRTPLLVREGRRLVLTEAARMLVGHTERILAELEQASAALTTSTGTVRGTVRLAAFPTAAAALVPGAIAECRAAHPDLRVVLEERQTEGSVLAVKAGQIDLALIYEYTLLPRVADPGIEVVPLLTETLQAVLPPGESWPDDPLRLAALRDERWIAPQSDSALRTVLDRACAVAGFTPQLDYTSDDHTVIVALVAAGLGVALIPPLAVESLSAEVQLRSVAEPVLTRTVSLVWRAGGGRHPGIAAVVDPLRRVAGARSAVR